MQHPSNNSYTSSQDLRSSSIHSASYSPISSSSLPYIPRLPSLDPQLQRLFEETLSNAKIEEVSEFLTRYSEFIDINAYDEEGQTPLQRSCQVGALPLVKLLIQYGANPGMTNREGWSPVHIASFSGNTELYSYIVRCNARSLRR
eukprot:TRINITY_DN3086_c0_g1_i2.p1 TRINITY_DN3086_c0_g1~~TRINITY_DN3086_c0_g1_i2.p1  ORF type:complete len:145 (-),score=39.44 TRINITY_DN3086_c0_g1_i2:1297-1731(-)